MELPPIALPPGSPGRLPERVVGTVEQVLGPNRYAVRVQNMLLEMEMELFLSLGDRVAFRVREQRAGRLVLELSKPADAAERPGSPPAGPGSRSIAAFLAGHGIEPAADLVAALARLDAAAVPPETGAALLQPLADALAARIGSPEEIAAKLPLLDALPPVPDDLARLLDASPRLRMLDQVISALQAAPTAELPAAEAQTRLSQVLALLPSLTPETAEAFVRALPTLSRDGTLEVLQRLYELERREIAGNSDLARARAARGSVLEAARRIASLRLVNQLARLRGDPFRVLELPVRVDGRVEHLPVRIRREGGGSGPAEGGGRVVVTIHAEMTKLGLLHAALASTDRALRVRFSVRDASVRAHLERGSAELIDALAAQGFEAAVASEVSANLEKGSIFDVFAAPGDSSALDLKA